MDWLSILAAVVSFLAIIITFKHVDLQIRIKNILDLHLKANKENDQTEEKKEEIPTDNRPPQ